MLAEETDISQTAAAFGVTLRALRFYEQIGLIKPERRGTARIYSGRDRVRIQLITTGKRLGLSLAQIRRMIATGSAKPNGETVIEASATTLVTLLSKNELEQQLQVLERQLADVESAIAELRLVCETVE